MKMESSSLQADPIRELESILDERLAKGVVEVPMLPTVASKVIALSQDADSDARKLSKLIQGDQAMAAHMMKVANSPVYSPNANIVSLQQAIARLGMRQICEIAVSVSINSKMFKAPGFKQEIEGMWKHSLATAVWSQEIARLCRRNVEAIFLCGLLHSIGRPAALQKIVEVKARRNLPLSNDDCLNLVDRIHSRFGIQIVTHWNMPKLVCDVLENFDDFSRSESARETTAVVVTGAAFATHMLDPSQMPEVDLKQLASLEAINLYPDQVESLMENTDRVQEFMGAMTA